MRRICTKLDSICNSRVIPPENESYILKPVVIQPDRERPNHYIVEDSLVVKAICIGDTGHNLDSPAWQLGRRSTNAFNCPSIENCPYLRRVRIIKEDIM